MELVGLRRARVSRETRLLLTAVAVAVAALWVLARLRFPEQPVNSNPIQPLLTQLEPREAFADLATEVAQVQPGLLSSLAPFDLRSAGFGVGPESLVIPALRFGSDMALTLLGRSIVTPGSRRAMPTSVIASDLASGLAVVRVPSQPPTALTFWTPDSLQYPRYLLSGGVSGGEIALRPVFIGGLRSITSPIFAAPIWSLPASSDLQAGAYVFTTAGALVGLIIDQERGLAIVPAEALIGLADQLLEEERHDAGRLGLEVQAMTPALAAAAGVDRGMVVTAVEPDTPASGRIGILDIIEALDGQTVLTLEQWSASMARLTPGQKVVLKVRRTGSRLAPAIEDVELVAAPLPLPRERLLGLTMRATRDGVEIVGVDPGSAAAAAGIAAGDTITAVSDIQNPSPANISQRFVAAPAGLRAIVALERAGAHRVVVLEKP